MNSAAISWGLLLGLATCFPISAAEQDAEENIAAEKPLAEQLKENPDDIMLIRKFVNENTLLVRQRAEEDPDAAEKLLAEMSGVIDSLEPETAAGKQLIRSAKAYLQSHKRNIELARVTLEEAAAKVNDEPNNIEAITLYRNKLMAEISPITRSKPDQAEEMLNSAKEFLAKVRGIAEGEESKRALDMLESSFGRLESSIETSKRLAALIGADAAPLSVEAWVNGDPLADEDLTGKVVLLDFWAVWCGPCIATFPHLREWHETYSEKGLVIIGLTNYYNYEWDEEANRPVRVSARREQPASTDSEADSEAGNEGEKEAEEEEVDEEVLQARKEEQEQQMLVKFAEHHELHHRFAIQKDRSLAEYYAVSGIPHVVVIDQEGKVRLIRIGSGSQNAQDIADMLEQLMGDA